MISLMVLVAVRWAQQFSLEVHSVEVADLVVVEADWEASEALVEALLEVAVPAVVGRF